jgi:hypothetical protein
MTHLHSKSEFGYSEDHFLYTKIFTQREESDLTNGRISYTPQKSVRIKIKWMRVFLIIALIAILTALLLSAGIR